MTKETESGEYNKDEMEQKKDKEESQNLKVCAFAAKNTLGNGVR